MSWAADKAWNAAVDFLQAKVLTNREYAKQVILPDGDFSGSTYDPDIHPAQKIIFDMLDEGATWLAILKPVQDGGSLASFVPMLRRTHSLGQTAIVAYPTQDKAKDAWSTKIMPMLQAQGNMLTDKGGGSRGGAARVLSLKSGGKIMLRSAGGRAESGQAADTTDVLVLDEADDWPSLRVVRLIERRLSKSRDPLFIVVSTLKKDDLEGEDESIMRRIYEQGTQTRLSFPCPHCGELHTWEHENLDVEREVAVCPHCHEDIDDSQRLAMLRHPVRSDGNTRSHKHSIQWTAFDSPFTVLIDGQRLPAIKALCAEYRQATESREKGDHGLIRQYFRDRWCRPYRDDLEEDSGFTTIPTRGRLAALSKASGLNIEVDQKLEDGDTWRWTYVPAWAEFLSVGIDVQAGGSKAPPRLYWVVYARGGGRGAVIGWGTQLCCPAGRQATEAELHAALTGVEQRIADAQLSVPIVWRGVDTGDQTDELLRWLRTRRDWHAVKGTGSMVPQRGDRAGWIYIRKQEKKLYRLRFIETSSVLRVVHGEVLAGDTVGGLALAHGLESNSALIRHICASVEYEPGKWSKSPNDKKHHPEWQRRNDYADALVYARAGAYEWETRIQSVFAESSVDKSSAKKQREKPQETVHLVDPMIPHDMADNWILG